MRIRRSRFKSSDFVRAALQIGEDFHRLPVVQPVQQKYQRTPRLDVVESHESFTTTRRPLQVPNGAPSAITTSNFEGLSSKASVPLSEGVDVDMTVFHMKVSGTFFETPLPLHMHPVTPSLRRQVRTLDEGSSPTASVV